MIVFQKSSPGTRGHSFNWFMIWVSHWVGGSRRGLVSGAVRHFLTANSNSLGNLSVGVGRRFMGFSGFAAGPAFAGKTPNSRLSLVTKPTKPRQD
jgi:hypothetical protein